MHATGYICNKSCQAIKIAELAIGCYQAEIERHSEEVIYQNPEVGKQEDLAEDEPQCTGRSWSKVGAGAMEGKKALCESCLRKREKKF